MKNNEYPDLLKANEELYHKKGRHKRQFLTDLQKKSERVAASLVREYPDLPIINMVMGSHWGWVFANMLSRYSTLLEGEYLVIPSVMPIRLKNCVYQYWRPVHPKTSQFFSNFRFDRKNHFAIHGVSMFHDCPQDSHRGNITRRIKNAKCVQNTLCTSQEQMEFFEERDIENCVYTPLPVDDKYELKGRVNLNRKLNVGFVGRTYGDGVKQESMFENIISQLKPKNITVSILSPNTKRSIKRIKAWGYDVRTPQKQFMDRYKAIDVLLITSKYEGTPLPLIESMKMGHTVISTRVGEAPVHLEDEYLRKTESGFVHMIEKIDKNRDILEENRIKNSEKVKHLTWENFLNKHRDVWTQVLQ